MQKKYQIFVSSTFRDLLDERQDAIRNILDLGHIPAGMELFPASDTEQLSYIKKVIDECDYYILIMGGRYGSLDENGVSFTELEYDYAVESGKVVLAFVHGDTGSISVSKSDTAPRMLEHLRNFRTKVMTGRLVKEWTTREALEPLVLKAIVRAISDYPATGWVRGDVAASTDTLQHVNDLLQENQQLKGRIRELKASMEPLLSNLASLDDTVPLRYSYRSHTGHANMTGRKDSSLSITWREVFTAVGPRLKSPTTSKTLTSALAMYIYNKKKVGESYILERADGEAVEGHLIALGLLKSYNAKSLQGGVYAYIELTDLGRKTLIELLAVRK